MKICSFFVVCGTIVATNSIPVKEKLPVAAENMPKPLHKIYDKAKPQDEEKHLANLPIAGIRAACVDELPQDYGTARGQCAVGWTCSDWAGKGSHSSTDRCLHDWINYRLCVPMSNGQVKDYCKKSCGNCGAG